MVLSVVVPCFNEEALITETKIRLSSTMDAIDEPYELLFINDGSRDHTGEILLRLAAADAHCRVLSFSRNFGHQNTVSAGIANALGDAVILIDADLRIRPKSLRKW